MTRYFAYGSNLLPAQMAERCPQSQVMFPALLHGYRFLIGERGYATIAPEEREVTRGVVFELSTQDEATLDRCEGVATGAYRKATVTVVNLEGGQSDVMTYIDDLTTPALPNPGYLERIILGAQYHGFPEEYLQFLQSLS